jgi:hypothetical protein
MSDVEMQEPSTPASNISRDPKEVEKMLRMTDDEGEGDERTAAEGDTSSQEPPATGTGTGTGSSNTVPHQQPAKPMEQQPQGDGPPLPAAQEGNKNATLSLSEIKKAVMDISNDTGTSAGTRRARARRGSDPGISVESRNCEAEKEAAPGPGFNTGSGSGNRDGSASKLTENTTVGSDTSTGSNNNISDLENDVFFDPLQGLARAPAVKVSLPVE